MKPNNSFALLQQLAEKRRDASMRKLGVALAQAQDADARLKLLVGYRIEYEGRLDRAQRGGIGGEGLRNYRTFIGNLERAIEQQSHALAGLRTEVLRLRDEIANEQRQIESYAVLLRRRARSEHERENRRSQALQDELATNSVIRRSRRYGGAD